MNKTTIVFRISGSEIALESAPGAVTAGSISEPQCRFRFSEQWDDYGAKLAFFGTDRDRLVPMALAPVAEEARSYYCYIPRAVLAGLQRGGELFICCSGSGSDSEAVLRTKLYTLRVADSGEAAIYLTESEAETLLGSVAAAMELQRNENALALELQRTENSATVASMRAENSAAIARLESGSIASAAINASHELVLTMKDGTAVNLGNVRGSDGTGIQSARVDGSGKLLITLSTGQVLDLGNVRGEPGDGITNAEVIDGVLWLTTLYGSRYSAGYVKGEKGEKGDKGDTGATGAQGSPGAAGADGEDGTDGISITGVVASIDSNNKRVFTFTFSDGSTRAVIVPGEVITITDEDGEHPQSIAVQAAVQGLGNAVVALDERSTTNSRRITALDESKANKTTITGTDGKQYTIRFTLVNGKPVLEYEEVTQ